ncbi:OmpA family protein [Archangium violaceum]|uniref:OmpA family protein n=1 Tax=Archangium violaceum TaxID=83451 RepID=UPI001EF3F336|nr:OmpA family protein [Archangium violaceum]
MDSPLKLALLTVLLCASTARAEDPVSAEQARTERVRAELDRQLQEMVTSSPPEVRLLFAGLDPAEHKLVEVHFTLDGQPLDVPPVEELGSPGPRVLTSRQVAEGPHTLVSNVVYMDASWNLFSETSGFLWNMTSTLNFQAQRGLRVDVKAVTVLVPDAKDPRLKLKLSHDVTVEMTAKLADGELPEPVPAPPTASTASSPEPRPSTADATQKGRLLVRATARRKPVGATLLVRGATQRQVALKRGARTATEVEMPPGAYTVDILAPGYLAQTRRVELAGDKKLPLGFELVRAPKRKLVQEKKNRLEPRQPLRFRMGQAAFEPRGAALLQHVVDALVRRPQRRLRIEGHSDNMEAAESERPQLSEARARAVVEWLVKAGVDPARIESAGFGDTRPKAPNLTPRGRELNRRVEFIVLEK